MIGQIGLVGGGLGLSMHYSGNGQAACDVKLPAGLPQGKNEVEEVKRLNLKAKRLNTLK